LSALEQAVLALVLSLSGWYLASRLRIPAAAILGPMVFVGAGAYLGLVDITLPFGVTLTLKIIVGAFIGCRVSRNNIAQIRSLGKLVAFVTIWMLLSTLVIGCLLALLTGIDLATALLGTSPGALSQMSLLAVSLDADPALVVSLQVFRLAATVMCIPLLASRGVAQRTISEAKNHPTSLGPAKAKAGKPAEWLAAHLSAAWWNPYVRRVRTSYHSLPSSTVMCLTVAAVGGCFFTLLQIPAGGLIGSMVAVATVQIAWGNLSPPPFALRAIAQMGVGMLVGVTFDEQTFVTLGSAAIAVIMTTAATVASGLALASVVRARAHVNTQTALLACAPGGTTQMTSIADDLGADGLVVSLFHLTRAISVNLVLPVLYRLLL
jgi:membrane AbrB-like protein